MKTLFYPRLAWSGIRKNKELYIPYLLTCMGMVMMFYIVSYLHTSMLLKTIYGGTTLTIVMALGRFVIGVFSIVFLFYTHSFLIRRRKKEFGLYSILGMNKRNLARIMIWESLMVAVIALVTGLASGVLFSKLAELLMNCILQGDVNYSLRINPISIRQTIILYLLIFFLILLVTLCQIRVADPIQLLRSENVGERPPKANWFLAVVGLILLGSAYYLAVSIEDPVSALGWFFIAVLLVIGGSYLLFISGSVALCRLLQKNKRYYYQTNHFVSVSSMVYRMKRNGAGLASICILSTMVLVMLVSTVCLYGGIEGTLRARYPRNIMTDNSTDSWEELQENQMNAARTAMEQVVTAHGLSMENVLDYSCVTFSGLIHDGVIETGASDTFTFNLDSYSDIWQIFVVPLSDYNRLMGVQESLQPGELLIYTSKADYPWESLQIAGVEGCWQVRKVRDFMGNGIDAMQIIPSLFLIAEDVGSVAKSMENFADFYGGRLLYYRWLYGFDLDCPYEEQGTIFWEINGVLKQLELDGSPINFTGECVAQNRNDFYETFGGLFFLGIMLGIVFVFAATLIMYYKQISEGYEDQGRFEILQKVGMTRKEIKRSINSQVMTVFFLPLLVAGVHLSFAFPFINRLLMLVGFFNTRLLIEVSVAAYLLFGVGYLVLYRITSRAYYHLVGGAA